jgi:uncharacterized protein
VSGSLAARSAAPPYASSDIDLLVDLAENRGFRDYLALVEELESLLGQRLEVIIGRSLSPHFRPYVEGEARPL